MIPSAFVVKLVCYTGTLFTTVAEARGLTLNSVSAREYSLIPTRAKHSESDCPARWIRPKLGSFDRSSLKSEPLKWPTQVLPIPTAR